MEFDEPPGARAFEPPPPPPQLPRRESSPLELPPAPTPALVPPPREQSLSLTHTQSQSSPTPPLSPPEERIPLWARLSVRHTKKTCLVALLVPIICTAIIVVARLFKLSESSRYEFIVKDHPVPELDHSRVQAREKYPYQTEEPEPFSELSADRQFTLLIRNTLKNGDPAKFVENAPRLNLLTREGIAFLKRAEDEVTNHPDYPKFCLRAEEGTKDCFNRQVKCVIPESVTNNKNLYGTVRSGRICRSSSSEMVSESDFDKFLKDVMNGTEVSPALAPFMGKDLSSGSLSTQLLRSFIPMGEEPENYTAPENQTTFRKWAPKMYANVEKLTNSKYHVYIISGDRLDSTFGPTIQRDQMFSIAAVVLVFIVIIIHTGSTYLASTAMLQIMLAFPFAYLVYRGIFQISYYGPLNVLTVFLILGIGADDVFVFVDAWKQAAVVLGPDVSLEKRMAWTYRRAVRAMSVTSFTTAVAFFTTAFSPIMPIATLGVWSGFLILLQFLLVITVFPSALVIWQRFWRPRRWYRCWKVQKDDSEPRDSDVTSATQSSSSAFLNGADIQEISLGAMQLERNRNVSDEESGDTSRKRALKKGKDGELRFIERLFNGPWTNLTHATRYPLVVISLALFGVSIWLATKLSTPVEPERFLPDDNPLIAALDLLSDGFPSKDGDLNVKVKLVWGLDLIDRTGTNKYDPDDLGSPRFDRSFDMRSAAAQRRIYEACNGFRDPSRELITNLTTVKEKVVCWPEDYAQWNRIRDRPAFRNFSTQKELIDDLIKFAETKVNGRQPFLRYLSDQYIVFNDERTRVLYTEIRFVSRLRGDAPYSITWPERNKWEKARLDFNAAKDVPGVENARVTAGQSWTFAVTQKALVDNMFLGIGVVLAVSFVSLSISTGNVVIAFLSLVAIAGILCNVLALIQLLGWKLGVTESIAVVIAIGFSFDYVAHVANAYVESPRSHTREQRTRAALTELGVSILAGAISTVLSGAMLFFAIIIFFVKFAVFVVSTVSFALLWGLVFFPAFLHISGPTGNLGEIWSFANKMLCGRRKDSDEVQFEPQDRVESRSAPITETGL